MQAHKLGLGKQSTLGKTGKNSTVLTVSRLLLLPSILKIPKNLLLLMKTVQSIEVQMLAKVGKELIVPEYEFRLPDRQDFRQTHIVPIGAFLVSSPARRTKRRIKRRRKEPWIE